MGSGLQIDVIRLTGSIAESYRLSRALVLAIIHVESSGDTFAWNPEPPYRYLYDVVRGRPFRQLTAAERVSETPPSDFPSAAGDRDAEWWGQQASWGLMQVMGGVARELGLSGHFPSLCDPGIGIRFGCMHLCSLRDRYLQDHGWQAVVAAYNAGSPRRLGNGRFENQTYVDKVLRFGGFSEVRP